MTFLGLPAELRNQIYIEHFASLDLANGKTVEDGQTEFNLGAAHGLGYVTDSLALLRICSQIYHETKNVWFKHVNFCYRDPGKKRSRLDRIPAEISQQIRRMTIDIHGYVAHLHTPMGLEVYRCALLTALNKGFNEMILDLLVIYGRVFSALSKAILDEQVQRGAGWKELRVVCDDLGILKIAVKDQHNGQSSWEHVLAKRDGEGSGGTVQIFRIPRSKLARLDVNPTVKPSPDLSNYDYWHNVLQSHHIGFMSVAPRDRDQDEIAVIIRRRGPGVDVSK